MVLEQVSLLHDKFCNVVLLTPDPKHHFWLHKCSNHFQTPLRHLLSHLKGSHTFFRMMVSLGHCTATILVNRVRSAQPAHQFQHFRALNYEENVLYHGEGILAFYFVARFGQIVEMGPRSPAAYHPHSVIQPNYVQILVQGRTS
jgi:hypothetical protein